MKVSPELLNSKVNLGLKKPHVFFINKEGDVFVKVCTLVFNEVVSRVLKMRQNPDALSPEVSLCWYIETGNATM